MIKYMVNTYALIRHCWLRDAVDTGEASHVTVCGITFSFIGLVQR